MKCPNCGKEIANDSQFCEFCGTQLKKSTKNPNTVWIILALLLCAVVIGVFVYSEHNAQQAAIEVANQRAEEARIAKEEAERKLRAAENARIEAERRAANEKMEEARKLRAAENARIEAERRAANEKMEEARKLQAAENARIEAERRAANERKQREEEQKPTKRKELLRLGYVDLGLPSGTLWKTNNEEGYYTFNEACKCFTNFIPSKAQWEELINYCSWTWQENKYGTDNQGYWIKGRTGASIFLPSLGAKYVDHNYQLYGYGQSGDYWSSSLSENGRPYKLSTYRAYFYNRQEDRINMYVIDNKANRYCVRLAY